MKSGLGVTQGHWNFWYGFLFTFRGNYGPILYHFEIKRDRGRKYLFSYPTCIRRPLGGIRRNIAIRFGTEKTTMMRLPDGEKSWRICFTRFETLYERYIQRDGGTPQDGIGRACSLAIGCSRATKNTAVSSAPTCLACCITRCNCT